MIFLQILFQSLDKGVGRHDAHLAVDFLAVLEENNGGDAGCTICVGAHSVRPKTEGRKRSICTALIVGRQWAHTVRPYGDFSYLKLLPHKKILPKRNGGKLCRNQLSPSSEDPM